MHWIWSVVAVLTVYTVRVSMPRREPKLYLSFDDGPHPEHTPVLLELLRAHNAKATFFLIGDLVEKYPHIVQQIVDEGHTIGNHSMTHPRLPKLTARDQLADIARADAVMSRFNGRRRQMFRPPNGRATIATIFNSLLKRQPLVLWSIDSMDYQLDAEQVAARLEKLTVRGGDILLFHDDGGAAHGALARLLPHWSGSGLRFAPL
jgi:peptidoglycan-N-acetylglucosamine deacetylase